MTQPQSTPESLQEAIQFLKTQRGFHRDKVSRFNEAIEGITHLPLDEDFLMGLLKNFRDFQGFEIVQFWKIISRIKELSPTHFQRDVEKILKMCQPGMMAMDRSVFLEVVLDILCSEEATEKTARSVESTVKELDHLFSELLDAGGVPMEPNVIAFGFHHPRGNFLDWHRVLKRFYNDDEGSLLIRWTSSLIAMDKSRSVLAQYISPNWSSSRAWAQILKTPLVSSNLALLIAEAEQDQYNALVQQQQDSKDQNTSIAPVILPVIISTLKKLTKYAEDPQRKQDNDVSFQMMQVPGSFDRDLSSWTTPNVSGSEVEKKWKALFKAATQWERFPVELTKLVLDASCTSENFELILQSSGLFSERPYFFQRDENTLSPDEAFIYLCNRILNKRRSVASTIAVVKFLLTIQGSKESDYTFVINLLKNIDDSTGEEGELADTRTSAFMQIFFNLHCLFWQTHPDFIKQVSADLEKCYSQNVSLEDLKEMVPVFLVATCRGLLDLCRIWKILLSIYCNRRLNSKTEFWEKYSSLLSSPIAQQVLPDVFVSTAEAIGQLSEKNGHSLLDKLASDPSCAALLSMQVINCKILSNGDIDRHYSLVLSVMEGTTVTPQLFQNLKVMGDVFSGSLPIVPSISEDSYNALFVAVTESSAKKNNATVERFAFRSIAREFSGSTDPADLTSLYLAKTSRHERAWNFCNAHWGDRLTMLDNGHFPVHVKVSELWMAVFTECTALLHSGSGSASHSKSLSSMLQEKVLQEGIFHPRELENVLMHFFIPVDQEDSTTEQNLALEMMEKLLNIPKILGFLGKIPSTNSTLSVNPPLIRLILDKCQKEREKAFEICRFLSALGNMSPLLLPVGLAVIENLEEQDLSCELEVLSRIWKKERRSSLLPLVADLLVTSYRYKVYQREIFVNEFLQTRGVGLEMHILLNASELFGKAWHKFGTAQHQFSRLRDVLSHLDEKQLSENLSEPTPEQIVLRMLLQDGSALGTAAKHKNLFCESFHWLLLETNLSPEDIALCIRLTLPCFDCSSDVLQGQTTFEKLFDLLSEGRSDQSALDEFSSPIKVAYAILQALRSRYETAERRHIGEEEMERHLLKRLLEVPCQYSWLNCSLRKSITARKQVVRDVLELVKEARTLHEILLWLEHPDLLLCGHAMKVVLEMSKWQKRDPDCENRINISCKVKTLLGIMKPDGFGRCLESCPFDSLSRLIQMDLKHPVTVKLLDLFLRDENAALLCGAIIHNWRSVQEEGVKLIEKFISLTGERNSWHVSSSSFELTHVLLDRPLQSGIDSAEHALRLLSQLRSQSRLQEHYPLDKAARWCQAVSKSGISSEITSSWLSIFRIAECRHRDVDVVTSLTPEVMAVLSPGSTCIADCLFSLETIQKILVSYQRVNEEVLKTALVLARLLGEFAALARQVHKDNSPCDQTVLTTLRQATCDLCNAFQEKLQHTKQDGHNIEKESKGTSFATSERLLAQDSCETLRDAQTATGVASNVHYPSTDKQRGNEGLSLLLNGAFSDFSPDKESKKESSGQGKRVDAGVSSQSTKISTKDLYRISRHYQQKVFNQMSKGWGFNADHLFPGSKTIREGLLTLVRRWLTTFGQHENKMPTTNSHVGEIFEIVSRANRDFTESSADQVEEVASSSTVTEELNSHQAGSRPSPDAQTCGSAAENMTCSPPIPISQERLLHESSGPSKPESITGTEKALATIALCSDPSLGPCSSPNESNSFGRHGTHTEASDMKDSFSLHRSSAKQKSTAAHPFHSSGADHQTHQKPLPQNDVRDYILGLEGNQACIARLQSAGYNQCDTLKDQSPVNLWYDSSLSLTGSVSKRRNDHERQATRQLRQLCNEYLDFLKKEEVQTVDVDGRRISVGNLFAGTLTWDELTQQIDVVKDELQKRLLQNDREIYKHLVQREQEMRRHVANFYFSADKLQTPREDSTEREVFTILWENRFFEAIRLCSENIPGCYAPGGFAAHKPIQCALCVDSKIISVFQKIGKHRKEVENVEVKLLEAGMFVFGLHSSQLEMDTDELWAKFYCFLLEKRLVPRIFLNEESPAVDWVKQFISENGNENLDANGMKFHETVIPMKESCYDFNPTQDESGRWLVMVLTNENVKQFKFSDIQLQNPCAITDMELRRRQLNKDVMNDLRRELLKQFREPEVKLLLKRLGHSVSRVCNQILVKDLPADEIEVNLKLGIDAKKLWKGIARTDHVGLQWFVDTIVCLIKEQRSREDDVS